MLNKIWQKFTCCGIHLVSWASFIKQKLTKHNRNNIHSGMQIHSMCFTENLDLQAAFSCMYTHFWDSEIQFEFRL